jgi:hypothetical protein
MGLSTSKSRVFSFSIQYPDERAVQPVTFTLPCRRPKSEDQRLTGEDGRASVNFCFEAFFRKILQESRLSISMHSRRVRSVDSVVLQAAIAVDEFCTDRVTAIYFPPDFRRKATLVPDVADEFTLV